MEATGLKMMEVFKGALPFLIAFLVVLVVIVLMPELSVWLPTAAGL
jgi:TRAP-type C4-dicarboxylate transport system permease large subunit